MELVSNPQSLLDFISQPWHWAVSGAAIASLVFLMTWMGHSFGVSTSFKVACSMLGAGKRYPFFDIDWKQEFWRIAFVIGAMIGGFISVTFLQSPEPVAISNETVAALSDMGMAYPAADASNLGYFPTAVFNYFSPKGIILGILGGFLVGFGARYGGGCTSGHAITGLSHLQLPSLLTVIGFFIGGLLMTHFLLPVLLG